LPIGKGHALLGGGGVASSLLGGWQINTIGTFETGTPFTITATDNSRTGGNHASRANCVGDPFQGATTDRSQYVNNAPGFFINPAAFALPGLGTFGTCAPRSVHGPGVQNIDLSVFKSFAVTERVRIEFRSEFFNLFNHANFQNPTSNYTPSALGSFGRTFSTIADPREIQFALKLYF